MNKFANISLLFIAFIWGATFVLVQNAIAFLEPHSFNSIRFFIAGLILFSWLLLFNKPQLKLINWKMLTAGIIIGVWLFIGYAFQTIGLLYTSSSKAGFITGLSVVLVPVLSFFFLKNKPTKNAIAGVSIATLGLYLLTMTDTVSLNIGDGLVFICAIGFAMQILFTGKYSNQFPALTLTVIQIMTVSLLSSLFAFFTEDWKQAVNLDVLLQGKVLLALLITSIFATALAFFAQTKFQQFISPTRVALIFAMEPVFAAGTAYLWANERLSYSALFGCILIFSGMIFADLPTKRKQKKLNKKIA
ncbi:drug/metabolite transporter (DMT)-like permease [Cytobacillus eiseniae]|uniref:Drug/metabolite transporter (DMT)-like permease n=1 Tax=Cytobacillus eiseniae TaxID=762947 RepID=A0ABS4REG3_9BACI|nr:DMT family transporter [Cytobacillus eiseniae]MBP2241291.1 drug/metabolite transporter (DMT)-like permease [Cytobacillus eiseniae]